MSSHHDVGGAPSSEPIDRSEHPLLPWEVRVDALMWTLTDATRPGGPQMTVDELRYGIESLPEADYRGLGYFEKWLLSMIAVMSRKGAVDRAALDERVAAVTRSYHAEHAREHADDGDRAHEHPA